MDPPLRVILAVERMSGGKVTAASWAATRETAASSASQSYQGAASCAEDCGGIGTSGGAAPLVQTVSQTLQDCPAVGSSQRRNQVDSQDCQRLSQHPCRAGG